MVQDMGGKAVVVLIGELESKNNFAFAVSGNK